MKIYLPTCLAVSALTIFATTASSMEQVSSRDKVSSNRGVASLSALKSNRILRIDSQKSDSLSFVQNEQDYSPNLPAKANSFALDASDIPASDLAIQSQNLGQPSYSVTTPVIKF